MAFSESSETFGSYLQNARIEQAALDLRQNSNGFQSITEIAYKHGFSSSSQFSRVFKRYLKLTPREYKKIHS
ncbi:helix-turn-helix transcriptional regulator [Halocynthiibacter namhaensis]|uniref:helix-turn-helix transcriptional regulator n=1 Tax=Halocynthiibacter namhaensis TaxID=1290553 RepID=UPI0009DE14AA